MRYPTPLATTRRVWLVFGFILGLIICASLAPPAYAGVVAYPVLRSAVDPADPRQAPAIVVTQQVSRLANNSNGTFDVTFSIVVQNTGSEQLNDVQVVDDLAATFGIVPFNIVSGPLVSDVATLSSSSNYTGSAPNTALLVEGGTLVADTRATITLAVRFTPGVNTGPFDNIALGSAVGAMSEENANTTSTLSFGLALISAHLFVDTSSNGVQDPGEPDLAGITAIVRDSSGAVQVVQTDANKDYRVAVLPGNVATTVDQTDPDIPIGYVLTTGGNGGANQTIAAAVGATAQVRPVGFGPVPTAVTLARFTADRQGTGIVVRWTTSAEFNTWGFHIYRSSSGQRADAVRVTPTLILAQGRGQGETSYAWTDEAVEPGVAYSYWLVETETSGMTHEYGPARVAVAGPSATHNIFVPLVNR